MLGGYWEDIQRDNNTNGFLGNTQLLGGPGVDPASGKYETYDNFKESSGKTLSGFGQVRWTIIDKLELAAGARYTWEKKRSLMGISYANPVLGPLFGIRPVGDDVDGRFKDTNWSPEVTLSYKPNTDSLLYAA